MPHFVRSKILICTGEKLNLVVTNLICINFFSKKYGSVLSETENGEDLWEQRKRKTKLWCVLYARMASDNGGKWVYRKISCSTLYVRRFIDFSYLYWSFTSALCLTGLSALTSREILFLNADLHMWINRCERTYGWRYKLEDWQNPYRCYFFPATPAVFFIYMARLRAVPANFRGICFQIYLL